MAKRTVFTITTPIPPDISRQAILDFIQCPENIIDLNPLVTERYRIVVPHDAEPDELNCIWYSLTDKVTLPGNNRASSGVSYTASFQHLPRGMKMHCRAPMGVDIRSKWSVEGDPVGEIYDERFGLGFNTPAPGLFIREDVELRCSMFLAASVKKQIRSSHDLLPTRLREKTPECSFRNRPRYSCILSQPQRPHSQTRFVEYGRTDAPSNRHSQIYNGWASSIEPYCEVSVPTTTVSSKHMSTPPLEPGTWGSGYPSPPRATRTNARPFALLPKLQTGSEPKLQTPRNVSNGDVNDPYPDPLRVVRPLSEQVSPVPQPKVKLRPPPILLHRSNHRALSTEASRRRIKTPMPWIVPPIDSASSSDTRSSDTSFNSSGSSSTHSSASQPRYQLVDKPMLSPPLLSRSSTSSRSSSFSNSGHSESDPEEHPDYPMLNPYTDVLSPLMEVGTIKEPVIYEELVESQQRSGLEVVTSAIEALGERPFEKMTMTATLNGPFNPDFPLFPDY